MLCDGVYPERGKSLDAASIKGGAVSSAVGLVYGVIGGEIVVSAEVLACAHIYVVVFRCIQGCIDGGTFRHTYRTRRKAS